MNLNNKHLTRKNDFRSAPSAICIEPKKNSTYEIAIINVKLLMHNILAVFFEEASAHIFKSTK